MQYAFLKQNKYRNETNPIVKWTHSTGQFLIPYIQLFNWKYHIKYKEVDCFTSFVSRQQTYRCHLTVIASLQAYQATAVSWHMYICCILRKEVKQSSPLYLIWHFQPPSYEMLSDGKDFIMSLVVSMGYCIEVVGKGGAGWNEDMKRRFADWNLTG